MSAAEELGGLDVLVNCVGVEPAGTIETPTDAQWHGAFGTGVLAIVRTSRAALPYLRESERAAIVNTCSVAACIGVPELALQSATSGAIRSLTRAMAADYQPEAIRVSCVITGSAPAGAESVNGLPLTPQNVAAAIVHLASPGGAALSGVEVTVDGGLTTVRQAPDDHPAEAGI